MKRCSVCGIEKNVTEFYRNTRYKDDLYPHCKTCYKNGKKKYKPEKGLTHIICSDCKVRKPVEEYVKSNKFKTGYYIRCKVCLAERYNKTAVTEGTRVCSVCEKTFPVTEFFKHKQFKGGRYPYCKTCYGKGRKLKTQAQKHYANMKAAFDTYNITEQGIQDLMNAQKGQCALCEGDFGELLNPLHPEGRQYHIDHDHNTGKVRGLLCVRCNMVLGLIEDSRILLDSIYKYLVQEYESGDFNFTGHKEHDANMYLLFNTYGITEETIQQILLAQHGCCPLCSSDFGTTTPCELKSDSRPYVIDHCHDTGVVRGLLCRSCNMSISVLEKTGILALKRYLKNEI